jgi:membrane protein
MSTSPQATADDDRGRSAVSPWSMPPSGWKDVLIRTAREASKDNAGLIAAGVAFYAFIAIVPTLGAIVLSYGLIASPATVLINMQSMARFLPGDIATLISDQLIDVVTASSSKKGFGILIAMAIAIFGARNASGAIIKALNIAYEEEEKRSFIKVSLMALAMTAAGVICALIGVAVMTAMRFLEGLIPNAPGIVVIMLRILAGLVLLGGAAAAAATLYRYAPSREKAKWSWLTPGTALAAIGWLALCLGFGIYITRFANYHATYGSLGAVVALLTFVYLASYIFLFGAELNSEFEHQTAKDTTEGAEQPLGNRGAWSADHVAAGAKDEGKEGERDGSPGQAAPRAESLGQLVAEEPATEHPYLVSRATNRAARLAGGAKIGMAASALATLSLSMLRRKGKAKAGAALLGAAAGLSLLRRKDER